MLRNSAKIFCWSAQYYQRIMFRPQNGLYYIALIVWGLWPPENIWRLKIYLELRYRCVLSTIATRSGQLSWQSYWIIATRLLTYLRRGETASAEHDHAQHDTDRACLSVRLSHGGDCVC